MYTLIIKQKQTKLTIIMSDLMEICIMWSINLQTLQKHPVWHVMINQETISLLPVLDRNIVSQSSSIYQVGIGSCALLSFD